MDDAATKDTEYDKDKCSDNSEQQREGPHVEGGVYDPEDPTGERKAEAVENMLRSYYDGEEPSKDARKLLDIVSEQKKKYEQAYKSQWEGEEDEDIQTEDLEAINNDPRKKILWAAENSKIDVVKEILEQDPELVRSVDEDCYTPLHRASYNGHVALCELLLRYGADVHSRTSDGWSPLHCACRWNQVGVASLLLQAGSDVNCLTKGKQTPLHLAASNQNAKEVLQLLLMNRWIDPFVINDGNDTAYQVCQRSGNLYHLFEMTLEHMQPTEKGKFPSQEKKEK